VPNLSELTKGLSPTQEMAFVMLIDKGMGANSYELGFSISTLRSLLKRGLATRKLVSGTGLYPRIDYQYKSVYRRKVRPT